MASSFNVVFLCISLLGFQAFVNSAVAQRDIDHFFSGNVMRGAAVTATLVDLNTGEVLESFRPDEKLCPASVWKIITAAAALDDLGPDFRFRTTIAYRGRIEGSTLYGDIYLVGGGDPSLGSRHFEPGFDALLSAWAIEIKALGIDSIAGAVVANSAHFRGDGIPRTRIWEDMANYYGAAVSGLNFHDNTYFIDFSTPPDPGRPAQMNGVSPEVPRLTLTSEVYSSTVQTDLAYIFGAPGSNERKVRGTLPLGRSSFSVKGSLPDPPLFAAYHLHERISSLGIFVAGGYRTESVTLPEPATLKRISEYRSPPLTDLVRHMLVESDNLFAECLLFQLGVRSGDPTLEGGIAALTEYYSRFTGLDKPFFAYDGSGLSRFNAISSAMVAQILVRAAQRDELRAHLLKAMPLAGKEGTVKYFAKNTNLDGNMRAKSGSMDKVKAYAGTFNAFSGRELGFAFSANNFAGSAVDVRIAVERWLVSAYGKY